MRDIKIELIKIVCIVILILELHTHIGTASSQLAGGWYDSTH